MVQVGDGPGQGSVVGAVSGEEGEGGDLEGPGLRVGGVEVQVVEFVEGHGIDGAEDVRGGDVIS